MPPQEGDSEDSQRGMPYELRLWSDHSLAYGYIVNNKSTWSDGATKVDISLGK